jgi:hypothetical protein
MFLWLAQTVLSQLAVRLDAEPLRVRERRFVQRLWLWVHPADPVHRHVVFDHYRHELVRPGILKSIKRRY